jgi:hypothetical protein
MSTTNNSALSAAQTGSDGGSHSRGVKFSICALCRDPIDPEHPGLDGCVREVNPETKRVANMHGWCLVQAIESLTPDELDTYMELVQA